MSSKLNIATPAQLAEKEAYPNSDLVRTYIQENEDGEGNVTYTISFIQQDAADASVSNVVELDYARPSDIPEQQVNELVCVCTDNRGTGGDFEVVIISADSTLEADITVEASAIDPGTYTWLGTGDFTDLSGASLQVGALEGMASVEIPAVENEPIEVVIKTPTLNEDGGVYTLTNEPTSDLLQETTFVLRVPIGL